MIFDLHCDTIWKIAEAKFDGKSLELAKSCLQIDEKKLIKGGYLAQCFAMFAHARLGDPYGYCKGLIKVFYEELEKCDRLRVALSYGDIIRDRDSGRISAILTMEDGAPLRGSLDALDEFYRLGVRMICLTWNYFNGIGYPNPEKDRADEVNGLTDFGRELICAMNKKGVIIDVSHLSDAGFYEAVSLSDKPIVASHSSVRSLCSHTRNLTDGMLKKLAENGGVVGINYAKSFLHDDPEVGKDTIPRVTEHINHIKRLIGTDHIALGSDFDGISADIALDGADKLPLLVRALEREGFTDGEIEGITCKNALRVFRECLK